MKGILAVCFIFLLGSYSAKANGKQDTAKKDQYILVVPFMPQMYEVTGDYFICKKSSLTPGELSTMIRKSLTATVVHNLGEMYNAVEIPGKESADNTSDLALMYKAIKIGYRKQRLKAYYKDYPAKGIFSSSTKKWGTDCINNDGNKPGEKNHKYADMRIVNDSIFKMLCEKNKAAYVLVLTQFEMYTRFKTCLDLQENIYQRDFYLHYALYNSEGQRMDGGVVANTWESDTNDAKTILEKNLATLSGLVIDLCRKYL